ncbi:hypothetical protein Taro_019941 [Colocasia esculenta]|uniref:WRKY domain-containing protein n=1 Tax=Colocasia esculenta TaxID=4460 RepID=A0A843UV52_COLES|nr:hypothetical protein [Colocasia esculenta]
MAEERGAPRAAAGAAAVPPRPTITLPPRSAYESLFRGGGGFGGPEMSPGPMTLVSSFFAEDDGEFRSFSQLLAGAMASPAARTPVWAAGGGEPQASLAPSGTSAAAEAPTGGVERSSGGVRPLGLMVSPPAFLTVPPALSPATLLDSPSFFSPSPYMMQGAFGVSHQQALAHVTAQAVQAAQVNAHMHVQLASHSDVSAAATSPLQPANSDVSSPPPETQTLTSDTKVTNLETAECSNSKQSFQSAPVILDKPADDGYNWRKYGQKQVKGSECPRSYYKCTHPNCPVKKKVERSPEGQVTEIIYKGQHNHQRPPPNKRAKESCSLTGGSNEVNGNFDVPDNSETASQGQVGNLNRSNEHRNVAQTSARDQESGQGTAEQLSGSSNGEEVGNPEGRTEDGNDIEQEPKRRKMDTRVTESSSSQRTVTEPRIIVQTTSEVDLLDDGYRWRKYGQKIDEYHQEIPCIPIVVCRSYYKCTNPGCNVRKHVERASTDPGAVITTYEGKHNHDVPAARNSSHHTANSGSANHVIQPRVQNLAKNPALTGRTDRSDDQLPLAVLPLKEEYEVT